MGERISNTVRYDTKGHFVNQLEGVVTERSAACLSGEMKKSIPIDRGVYTDEAHEIAEAPQAEWISLEEKEAQKKQLLFTAW